MNLFNLKKNVLRLMNKVHKSSKWKKKHTKITPDVNDNIVAIMIFASSGLADNTFSLVFDEFAIVS